jgi:peptidoglycan/LPS O-acetylase OafA/YrhL
MPGLPVAGDSMPADHSRENNFDLLRLLFAYLVLFYHANVLFAIGFTSSLFDLPGVAVDGFFIISGFLIAWSFERDRRLFGYGVRRLFRIYPLYFVVVTSQLVILWLLDGGGVKLSEAAKYYGANLLFLNFLKPTFGDALDGMSRHTMNGSLWTLKIEVAFYVALPLLVFVKRKSGIWSLFLLWALSIA